MENYSKELINFLNSDKIKKTRLKLYKHLGADLDKIFIYYLVPFENLKLIIKGNGIKCRDNTKDIVCDLSGHNVQKKRHNMIFFKRNFFEKNKFSEKKIHQCLNFFFNPTNFTLWAFQRNQVLNNQRNNRNNYYNICILELDLEKVFTEIDPKWTISEKNLASNDFASFSKQKYEKFKWDYMLSLKSNFSDNNEKELNQYRSAEFIIFNGTDEQINSNDLPLSYINRIMVTEDQLDTVKTEFPSFAEKIEVRQSLFFEKKNLLSYEEKFISYIIELDNRNLITLPNLIKILLDFYKISNDKDFNIKADRFEDNMAFGQHGIGHTIRVMFWVHFLANQLNLEFDDYISSLYAALCHDLGKSADNDNEKHGLKSFKKYESFLENAIKDKIQFNQCKDAIIFHSIEDNRCPTEKKNLIWKILKDADALDRGRFGKPDSEKGCKGEFFRLDFLKNNLELNRILKELAFLLYKFSSYTNFGNKEIKTSHILINEIITSISAYKDVLNDNQKAQTIEKILQELKKKDRHPGREYL